MTVSGLIDYLQQFPGDTRVVATEADAVNLPLNENYVALDILDYDYWEAAV